MAAAKPRPEGGSVAASTSGAPSSQSTRWVRLQLHLEMRRISCEDLETGFQQTRFVYCYGEDLIGSRKNIRVSRIFPGQPTHFLLELRGWLPAHTFHCCRLPRPIEPRYQSNPVNACCNFKSIASHFPDRNLSSWNFFLFLYLYF